MNSRSTLMSVIAAAALLAACEARFGNDAGEVSENATAAGRAEEGRFTVEAPGFNMSISIPETVRAHANMEGDGLIYPGSTFSGMHVEGGRDGPNGDGGGEVEIRFNTADAADRVVAWYRDPARQSEVNIASAQQEGNGFTISGTGQDGERFTVRLTPRPGGGTDARLLLSDRH